MCMRPHTLEMPLQVLLRVFDQPEETVELPDDATGLTVKEWVSEKYGIEVDPPGGELYVLAVRGGMKLKNEVLLSSGPDGRYLKLKVIYRMNDG